MPQDLSSLKRGVWRALRLHGGGPLETQFIRDTMMLKLGWEWLEVSRVQETLDEMLSEGLVEKQGAFPWSREQWSIREVQP
jgi:hypothetical protein